MTSDRVSGALAAFETGQPLIHIGIPERLGDRCVALETVDGERIILEPADVWSVCAALDRMGRRNTVGSLLQALGYNVRSL